MAYLMVDGSANGLGIGAMARRGIIQRGWYGVLHVDHVVVTQSVQFSGRDARLYMRRDEIKHLRGETTRHPHFQDVIGRFDVNAHGVARSKPFLKAPYYRKLVPCMRDALRARMGGFWTVCPRAYAWQRFVAKFTHRSKDEGACLNGRVCSTDGGSTLN